MADKEYTYSDVSEHNTKKDLFIVVHDKVYNASSFVDEHPYVAPARHTHTHTHIAQGIIRLACACCRSGFGHGPPPQLQFCKSLRQTLTAFQRR